jgi:hypothetical protein
MLYVEKANPICFNLLTELALNLPMEHQCFSGLSVLHYACLNPCVSLELIEHLVELGADINSVGILNQNLLM